MVGASSSDPRTVQGGGGVPSTSILASRTVIRRLINDLTANVPAEDIDEFRSYVDKLLLPSGSSVGSAAYGAAMQDVHTNAKTTINAMPRR